MLTRVFTRVFARDFARDFARMLARHLARNLARISAGDGVSLLVGGASWDLGATGGAVALGGARLFAQPAPADRLDRLGASQPLPRLVRGDLLQRQPAAVAAVIEKGLEVELLQQFLGVGGGVPPRVVAVRKLDLRIRNRQSCR